MKKILSATLALSLLTPSLAHADGHKRAWTATTLIGVGGLMMLATVEDDTTCPAGYSTHHFDDIPTQCSYIGRSYSNITEATTTWTVAYPKAFATGVALVGAGIIVATLPKKAKKYAPDISASPRGVTLSKTVTFR